MELLKVNDYSFQYSLGKEDAVKHLTFSAGAGEFLVICGPSGCGKSTLLRSIKPQLRPYGEHRGEILFDGTEVNSLPAAETSAEIGFVMQNPDAQIVTDKVWHELAFGLENLGVPNASIRSRVAEMASYFGIHSWFRKGTDELSGGQKQLLNLASVMLMRPKLLILDEPSSQLDPIAAREFLENVRKINLEFGTTILITEHNLEEVYGFADRVLLMGEGEIRAELPPAEMARWLAEHDRNGMREALPTPARVYTSVLKGECPLSVVEGRRWISALAEGKRLPVFPEKADPARPERQAIGMEEVWFQYEKGSDPVLRNMSIDVRYGEITAMLGGNGSGKTTALSVLCGKNKAGSGKITIAGKRLEKYKGMELFEENLGVLPQNPQSLFVFETLRRDLEEIFAGTKLPKAEAAAAAEAISEKLGIAHLLERHPYDLSGGEIQKAALAKILLKKPKILLLDEPTKGMDALSKKNFGALLQSLRAEGAAILMVSHDVEFCANYADRCAMFFDGYVVSEGTPHRFFSGNSFYTTAASRMTRHLAPGIITCREGEELCAAL